DLETLFGPRGASGGCWCMWWRLKRSQYEKTKGEGNKRLFKRIVDAGAPTGILAYAAARPIGWCAVAPRPDLPVLENSRILRPVDSQPVWSVTCFYVAREWRCRGITSQLLKHAVRYAQSRGATIVEGYPRDSRSAIPDAFAWTGFASPFRRA